MVGGGTPPPFFNLVANPNSIPQKDSAVADWVSTGAWQLDTLEWLLPRRIIVRIHALPPPSPNEQNDKWC